ncbi:MAG: hypothetical protein H6862_00520 [Rhodospirillales bacterium]|nr:hypothetical protein [Rhodospirillales bacterium]
MSISSEDLTRIKDTIAAGKAKPESFLIGTDGDLGKFKGALAPIFAAHGGQIKAEFLSIRCLLVNNLPDRGLDRVAALPQTNSVTPDYKARPC